MLIKHVIILLINILFLLNGSVKANTDNYIVGNNKEKINQRIDDFFMKYPNERNVFWAPEIYGKSRYAFSIQRDAFLTSKKYADASDLYYLSKKIDEGLSFEHNETKQIDISFLKNNFNMTYIQKHPMGIKTGVFFEKKDNSFGMILNKDFIIFKNALSSLGVEQAKGEYTVFNAKFIKLSNNENSELYGNINHEFKSNHLNVGISNTWFDMANQFDLTLGIHEQDKKVESEIYATFGDEGIKFQIGLNQIVNNSNMNMFFNLKLENTLNKRTFGSNIMITSKESTFGLKKLSLKSFRKKNLDKLWKKYMNYN